MGTFQTKPTATITANLVGQNASINISGVTPANTTTEAAATHINTVLDIVGKSVASDGMTRKLTQEGVD